ncbi:hypothetical protein NL676_038778 [Syzygium grande]|nr:hypothetical protein NL676_038778 [Syzygium grande]
MDRLVWWWCLPSRQKFVPMNLSRPIPSPSRSTHLTGIFVLKTTVLGNSDTNSTPEKKEQSTPGHPKKNKKFPAFQTPPSSPSLVNQDHCCHHGAASEPAAEREGKVEEEEQRRRRERRNYARLNPTNPLRIVINGGTRMTARSSFHTSLLTTR